jgi:hypothetical protein
LRDHLVDEEEDLGQDVGALAWVDGGFVERPRRGKNEFWGSILVCQIFTITAEISDEIYGCNRNWILVFFPPAILPEFSLNYGEI